MELSTDSDYRDLLGRIWCDTVAPIKLVACRRMPSLKTAFPDMPRLSPRHLKYMRKFAGAWPDRAIVQRCVARLPWSSKRLRISGTEISETVPRNSIVSHRPTMILPTSPAFVAPELIEKLFTRFTSGWSHYVTLLSVDSSKERQLYEIEATANAYSVRGTMLGVKMKRYLERMGFSWK